MPNIPLALPGGQEGGNGFFGSGPGFDIGDVFGPNSIFSRLGGLIGPQQGVPGNGAIPGAPQIPVGQVPGGVGGAGCIPGPFRPGAARLRAQVFPLCRPDSGAIEWFGPKGPPVLYADDLRACKRVSRVAARANKARPRARRRGRR